LPVTGEKGTDARLPPLEDWRLVLDGLVTKRVELTYPELQALPQRELLIDIHCVTGWSRLGTSFVGISLSALLADLQVEPLPEARFVRFVSYSARSHDTSLPLNLALADTWLVHGADGQPLSLEHGYPLRTVTPSRYFYKSLKWVHLIEFLAEDQLGYWERESFYHNNADPWPGNERYTTGSHDPKDIEIFRTAASYIPYRGPKKMLLSVDLRGWAPKTRDLGNLHIKDCDLRGARLDGVDLREANLTCSDLGGASLVGADLRTADLEGVSFIGADLSGADLRGTALSATRFFERDPDGRTIGAKIEGLNWEGATGLLEDQEDFLVGHVT
jgi:hypothetical protein